VFTFQALSEEDRDLWLDAMDGKEPMFVHPPRPSDANQTYLDEAGFNFIAKCFQVLENRGTKQFQADNRVPYTSHFSIIKIILFY
jgi:hypothetical protein